MKMNNSQVVAKIYSLEESEIRLEAENKRLRYLFNALRKRYKQLEDKNKRLRNTLEAISTRGDSMGGASCKEAALESLKKNE